MHDHRLWSTARTAGLLGSVLSLCLAVATTTAPANAAVTPAATKPGPAVVLAPALTADAARQSATGGDALRAYWTPERMRAAEAELADPTAPITPLATPQAFAMDGPYTAVPNSVIGKVFFTRPDGVNSSCSGSVVTAQNRSLILTAAHCILPDGRFGPMNNNLVFVPAAHRGTAPFGVWTPRTLVVMPQWMNNLDLGYDVGALVVLRDAAGRGIEQVLGAFGIGFNPVNGAFVQAVGYPVGGRFGTEIKQWYCDGNTSIDQSAIGAGRKLLMQCDQIGGASGGPWYNWFSVGGVVQPWILGMFSHKAANPAFSFSPYFDNQVVTFYQSVSTL